MKAIVEKAIGDDGRALWEEKFPLEFLLRKKSEAGSVIFGMQYQNDVELAKGQVFKIEWMKFHEFSFSDIFLDDSAFSFYQGIDPAISRNSKSDYFALITIAVDRDRNIFVADTFRAHLSFTEQLQAIEAKIIQFHPVIVGVEAVAYQEALAESLRLASNSYRFPAPLVRSVSQVKDKQSRACRLSALFENGTLQLGKNQKELLEELLLFPDGSHDDLVDALEIAVRVSTRFKSRCSKVTGV